MASRAVNHQGDPRSSQPPPSLLRPQHRSRLLALCGPAPALAYNRLAVRERASSLSNHVNNRLWLYSGGLAAHIIWREQREEGFRSKTCSRFGATRWLFGCGRPVTAAESRHDGPSGSGRIKQWNLVAQSERDRIERTQFELQGGWKAFEDKQSAKPRAACYSHRLSTSPKQLLYSAQVRRHRLHTQTLDPGRCSPLLHNLKTEFRVVTVLINNKLEEQYVDQHNKLDSSTVSELVEKVVDTSTEVVTH